MQVRGRPRRYDDPRIKTILTRLWKAGNLPCGKRLRAMIPLWLPFYVLKSGQPLPETIRWQPEISMKSTYAVDFLPQMRYFP
jgi:hypothetical protein